MMRFPIPVLLLVAVAIPARPQTPPATPPPQTIIFAPQPTSRIPGLNEYRVYISSANGQPGQVRGMEVIVEAQRQKIQVYSYVNLQAYLDSINGRSAPHYIGVGLEVVGWVATAAMSADWLKIKESWKAAIPTVTGGLTLARTILERDYKPTTMPGDLMQPLIAVPAGGSVDFAVFAQ